MSETLWVENLAATREASPNREHWCVFRAHTQELPGTQPYVPEARLSELRDVLVLADTALQKLIGHCSGHNCMIAGCAEARKVHRRLRTLIPDESQSPKASSPIA